MSVESSARQRRRALAATVLRSLGSVVLLTAMFYAAPLDRGFGVLTVVTLGLGLVTFGLVVAWQVAAITHARYPRLRAIEALATAVPLFLLLFSAAYVLLSQAVPQSFSEPLNRTGALYFTVTVFATVGFGDIVPTSEAARALTTGQMVADLIVVGVVAKMLFGAVQIGVSRRASGSPGGAGSGPGGSSIGGAERK
ncbi:potassium channel family protein [Streptomyces sp. 12297]|uniref:potassium channel family protein n=1 Tax=Streptomyces sp. NBC_00239 TaxID=2903640 RepID=UPI002E2973A0|nr:ion channel [Streptomyces sp. NBC_00239]